MEHRLYVGNCSFVVSGASPDPLSAEGAPPGTRSADGAPPGTLLRIVGGVTERLCWRFIVGGKAGPDYEPASGSFGPLDPDRARRLKRGETFQRLDRAGRPRRYEGLSWQPATATPTSQLPADPTADPAPSPLPGEARSTQG